MNILISKEKNTKDGFTELFIILKIPETYFNRLVQK